MALTVNQREAQDEAFSVSDYGSVGDQRPYQIIRPAYPAPEFMKRFMYLNQAIRECQTLCQDQGRPFRLVKWGARIPCQGCSSNRPLRTDRLPSFTVSRSLNGLGSCNCKRLYGPSLDGFPDARVVADVKPGGQTIVYGPSGAPQLVGAPNYVITTDPLGIEIDPKKQPSMRYLQAVKAAQVLASRVGKTVYICSKLGCRGRKGAIPVVYVQPGGITRANPAIPGGDVVVSTVSPEHYKELIMESRGGSYLPANA